MLIQDLIHQRIKFLACRSESCRANPQGSTSLIWGIGMCIQDNKGDWLSGLKICLFTIRPCKLGPPFHVGVGEGGLAPTSSLSCFLIIVSTSVRSAPPNSSIDWERDASFSRIHPMVSWASLLNACSCQDLANAYGWKFYISYRTWLSFQSNSF